MILIYLLSIMLVFQNCNTQSNFKQQSKYFDENSKSIEFTYLDSLYINGHMLNSVENEASKVEIKKVIDRLKSDISNSKSKVDKFYASAIIMKLHYQLKQYEEVNLIKSRLLKNNMDNSYVYYISGLMFESDSKLDSALIYYSNAYDIIEKDSALAIELNFLIDNDFDNYAKGLVNYGAAEEFVKEMKNDYESNKIKFRSEYIKSLLMSNPNFKL